MRAVLAGWLLLTMLLVGPAPAQGPVGSNHRGLIPEQELNRLGLTRSWWGHAVMNRQRDKLSHLTADETLVVGQSSTGVVSAFDAESGKLKWYKQPGTTDSPAYPAAYNDKYVFIIHGSRLSALKRDTGVEAFTLGLPSQPSSSAIADDKQIYFGCLDGSIFAYDLVKTEELHRDGKLPEFADVALIWRYRTSRPIPDRPVLQGSQVVFSSLNGSVYAVSALDRKLAFQFETDAALSAPMARYKDLLILASEDFNVYAIDLSSGRLRWQFTTGLTIKQPPVVVGDDVYVLPERGSMYKANARTGERLWTRAGVKSFLSASPKRLYVVDTRNNMLVLNRETGDPLGTLPLNAFTQRLTNTVSDRIYLGTESGFICALREQSREFPTLHQRPQMQPLSPTISTDKPEAKAADAEGEMNAEESSDEDPAAEAEATPEDEDQ